MAWTDIAFPSDLPDQWEFATDGASSVQTADQHVRAVYINPDADSTNLSNYLLVDGLDLSTNGGFTSYVLGPPVSFTDWTLAAIATSTVSVDLNGYAGKNYCSFVIDASNNEASISHSISGATDRKHYVISFVANVDNAGSPGSRPTLSLECPSIRGGSNDNIDIEITSTSNFRYAANFFSRSVADVKIKTSINCTSSTINITDVEMYECSPVGVYIKDYTDRVFLRTQDGVLEPNKFYFLEWEVIPRTAGDIDEQEYEFTSVDFYNGIDDSGERLSIEALRTPGKKSGRFKATVGPLGANGKIKFSISDVTGSSAGNACIGSLKIKKVLAPSSYYDPQSQNPNNVRTARRGLQKLGEYEIPNQSFATPIAWAQDHKVFVSGNDPGTVSAYRFYVGKNTPGGSERLEPFSSDISSIAGSALGSGMLSGSISEVSVLPRDYMSIEDAAEAAVRPTNAVWTEYGTSENLIVNGSFEDSNIEVTSSALYHKWSVTSTLDPYVNISDNYFNDALPILGQGKALRLTAYESGATNVFGLISQKATLSGKTSYSLTGETRHAFRGVYEFYSSYPALSMSIKAPDVGGFDYYYDYENHTWSQTTFKYTHSIYSYGWNDFEYQITNQMSRSLGCIFNFSVTSSYVTQSSDMEILVDNVRLHKSKGLHKNVINGSFNNGVKRLRALQAEKFEGTFAPPWIVSPGVTQAAYNPIDGSYAVIAPGAAGAGHNTMSQVGVMDFTQKYIVSCYARNEDAVGLSRSSIIVEGKAPSGDGIIQHYLGPIVTNSWTYVSTIINGNPRGPDNETGALVGSCPIFITECAGTNNVHIDELHVTKLGEHYSPDPWVIDGRAENILQMPLINKLINYTFSDSVSYWKTSSQASGECDIINRESDTGNEDNYLFWGKVATAGANYNFQLSQGGGMDPNHEYVALVKAKASSIPDPENPPSLDIVGLSAFGALNSTVSNYITLSDEWETYITEFIGAFTGSDYNTDIGRFILRGGNNLTVDLEVYVDEIHVYEKEVYDRVKRSPASSKNAHMMLYNNYTSSVSQELGKFKFMPGETYNIMYSAHSTHSEYPSVPLYISFYNKTQDKSYMSNSAFIGYGFKLNVNNTDASTVIKNVGWQSGERYNRVLVETHNQIETRYASTVQYNRHEISVTIPESFNGSDDYRITFDGHIEDNSPIYVNSTFSGDGASWDWAVTGTGATSSNATAGINGGYLIRMSPGAAGSVSAGQTVLPGASDALGTTLFRVIVDVSATDGANLGSLVNSQEPKLEIRAGTSYGNTAIVGYYNSNTLSYNAYKSIVFNDVYNSVDGTLAIVTATDTSGDNIIYNLSRARAYERRDIDVDGDFTVGTGWSFTPAGATSAGLDPLGGIGGSQCASITIDDDGSDFVIQTDVTTYSYTASASYVLSFLGKCDKEGGLRIAVYGGDSIGSQTEGYYSSDLLTKEWKEYMIPHYGQTAEVGLKISAKSITPGVSTQIDKIRLYKFPFTASDNTYETTVHIDSVEIKK